MSGDGKDTPAASSPAESTATESATTKAAEQQAVTSTQPRGAGGTRISGVWTAVTFAVIVLLLLLIFILQNLQPVAVSYFGITGQIPLGVALLLGAVGGALLVIVIGVARILQLRHLAWRYRRQGRKRDRQEESRE